eukprot:1180211-Prorocentrum_minimum.AAC.4
MLGHLHRILLQFSPHAQEYELRHAWTFASYYSYTTSTDCARCCTQRVSAHVRGSCPHAHPQQINAHVCVQVGSESLIVTLLRGPRDHRRRVAERHAHGQAGAYTQQKEVRHENSAPESPKSDPKVTQK